MSKELVQIDGTAPTPAAGRKLKAMLLFPPEWVPTAPYLALPSLTAVLRQHGVLTEAEFQAKKAQLLAKM